MHAKMYLHGKANPRFNYSIITESQAEFLLGTLSESFKPAGMVLHTASKIKI